jgi:hypothetical protein
MSEAADSAKAEVWLADFCNVDGAGKLNVVGGGITMIGVNPALGVTTPFAVVARVSFAPKFVGESPAVELALERDDGSLVMVPGPTGPQYVRVGSAGPLKPAVAPGAHVPPNTIRPSTQFVMHFANGLPLEVDHAYMWRVKIDHDTCEKWTEIFYVVRADPQPVTG